LVWGVCEGALSVVVPHKCVAYSSVSQMVGFWARSQPYRTTLAPSRFAVPLRTAENTATPASRPRTKPPPWPHGVKASRCKTIFIHARAAATTKRPSVPPHRFAPAQRRPYGLTRLWKSL
jgi:hypothetical protein